MWTMYRMKPRRRPTQLQVAMDKHIKTRLAIGGYFEKASVSVTSLVGGDSLASNWPVIITKPQRKMRGMKENACPSRNISTGEAPKLRPRLVTADTSEEM